MKDESWIHEWWVKVEKKITNSDIFVVGWVEIYKWCVWVRDEIKLKNQISLSSSAVWNVTQQQCRVNLICFQFIHNFANWFYANFNQSTFSSGIIDILQLHLLTFNINLTNTHHHITIRNDIKFILLFYLDNSVAKLLVHSALNCDKKWRR
jgi:hypothetical protein